jgi:hypothetical protein
MPLIRIPAGPSSCNWIFEGLPAGSYSILVEDADSARIVGTTIGTLAIGATSLLTVAPADVEIEGRLVSEGELPSAARLVFGYAAGPDATNEWRARVGSDGSYAVILGRPENSNSVFVRVEADGEPGSQAINSAFLKSVQTVRGLQRIDLNASQVPPAIIRVTIPPIADASYASFVNVRLDDESGTYFKAIRGFTGQALVAYGTHRITAVDSESKRVLASETVVVSADRRTVTLTIGISGNSR